MLSSVGQIIRTLGVGTLFLVIGFLIYIFITLYAVTMTELYMTIRGLISPTYLKGPIRNILSGLGALIIPISLIAVILGLGYLGRLLIGLN